MQLTWKPMHPGGHDRRGPMIATSVTDREAAELRRLAHGKRVLEIGSGYGASTVALALVAESVTTIDNHTMIPETRDHLLPNLRAWGVADRVEAVTGEADVELARLLREGRKFGMAFIDGTHSRSQVAKDARACALLVELGGFLAFHDYGEVTCPDVKIAVDALFGGRGKLTDTLYVVDNAFPELARC